MIHLVPQPNGIDYPISNLQTLLYETFYVMWGESGMTGENFDVFGRTYRNSVVDGFVPQWYKSGKDYSTDMFFNDKKAAVMWFGLNDPTTVEYERYVYNLSLYVMVNLERVRPINGNQRMDERVIQDVCNFLVPSWYGFVVKAVVRDIDNVLSRYSGSKRKSATTDTNHQPKCCFRIDLQNAIDIKNYDCVRDIPRPQYFYAMTAPITCVFKTVPNTALTQTLWNGVKIQVEYPTGSSVTVPHLVGRDVFPDQLYNWTPQSLPYDATTGTFTFNFQDGDILRIQYNENQ
jgi:hypothetical protein